MTSSAQLEHEAERTRAHISADLDELRVLVAPEHLLDRVVDYAKSSGPAEFTRNLRDQVVHNPMPIAVIGAGLAWAALSGIRPAANAVTRNGDKASANGERTYNRETGEGWDGDLHDDAVAMGDGAGMEWAGMRDAASQTISTAGTRIKEASQAAGDGAMSGSQAIAGRARAAEQNLMHAGSSVRSSMASIGNNLSDSGTQLGASIREHPLLLSAFGVVIGALIGAVLPSTETENRVMGERSDELKEKAAGAAREQTQKGAAVAEAAWQGAKKEAEGEERPSFDRPATDGHAKRGDGAADIPLTAGGAPEQ